MNIYNGSTTFLFIFPFFPRILFFFLTKGKMPVTWPGAVNRLPPRPSLSELFKKLKLRWNSFLSLCLHLLLTISSQFKSYEYFVDRLCGEWVLKVQYVSSWRQIVVRKPNGRVNYEHKICSPKNSWQKRRNFFARVMPNKCQTSQVFAHLSVLFPPHVHLQLFRLGVLNWFRKMFSKRNIYFGI